MDGYSKFELGLQPSLARNLTKHWEVSAFVLTKRVTISDATIFPSTLVGPDEYLVNSIGVSTTLGVLVGARKRLRAHGGALAVVCPDPDQLGLFEMTGLDRVFSIHPDRDSALAAARSGSDE